MKYTIDDVKAYIKNNDSKLSFNKYTEIGAYIMCSDCGHVYYTEDTACKIKCIKCKSGNFFFVRKGRGYRI